MQRKTCEECGGKIKVEQVDFSLYGKSLGLFPAEVCVKCQEQVFDEATAANIDQAAKDQGLWGLEAQAKITKVGSSSAVIINKKLTEFMDLKPGQDVHVYPESKHKLIIEV